MSSPFLAVPGRAPPLVLAAALGGTRALPSVTTPVLGRSAYQCQPSLSPSLFPSPVTLHCSQRVPCFSFSLSQFWLLFSAVQNAVLARTQYFPERPVCSSQAVSSPAPCTYTWLPILIQEVPLPSTFPPNPHSALPGSVPRHFHCVSLATAARAGSPRPHAELVWWR